jgi:hypothetical protein
MRCQVEILLGTNRQSDIIKYEDLLRLKIPVHRMHALNLVKGLHGHILGPIDDKIVGAVLNVCLVDIAAGLIFFVS